MTTPAAIAIRDLEIIDSADARVLSIPRLDLAPGGRLALMGRSGSGKTTLARALVGGLPSGLRTSSGTVTIDGTDVLTARPDALRRIRRRSAYVDQDPGAALTPWLRVGRLVEELEITRGAGRDLLRELGLPTDDVWLGRRPPELSGGQRRRVALARALACDPGLLILDEPTAGLDTGTAQAFLALLTAISGGRTLVVVTHDPAVAAGVTDSVVTLVDGEIDDDENAVGGTTDGVNVNGQYVVVGPGGDPVTGHITDPPSRPITKNTSRKRGCSFESVTVGHRDTAPIGPVNVGLAPGTVTALIGRSGSGKSTLLRAAAGLHPPLDGRCLLHGDELAPAVEDRTRAHIRSFALVPQESALALAPSVRVGRRLHRLARQHGRRVEDVCRELGLSPELLDRTPGELSGGQRQRVVLAAALLREPEVLLVDEPTAALDSDTAHLVMRLLRRAAAAGAVVLVATHDPIVVDRCDAVLSLD